MKQVVHGSNLGVYEAEASEDHILIGPVRRISQRKDRRIENAGQHAAALAKHMDAIGNEPVVIGVLERAGAQAHRKAFGRIEGSTGRGG